MRCARLTPLVAVWFVCNEASAVPPMPVAPELSADEQTLKAAHLGFTPPELLQFFQRRAAGDAKPGALAEAVRCLGDGSAAVRERAFAELVSRGAAAVPLLRQAANNLDDLEAADRARECLKLIEGGADLVKAAARLLARHQPAGAAGALLVYLPFADDEALVREVETALEAVALRDGQPDPTLLEALRDPVPVRRGVAAEVLCKAGGTLLHPRVAPLLKDPKPTVRLHAALGMAHDHDATVIPVVIDLLAELPPEPRKKAEAYLAGLAGPWAVTVPDGPEKLLGGLRRDVWAAWWKAIDDASLLAELQRRTLGDADREEVLRLIRQLGEDDPTVREKASAVLLARGAAVAPLLHQAQDEANPAVRLYAAQALRILEAAGGDSLPAAVLRLLAVRKPAGTAAALLAYLPFAENRTLAEEAQTALQAVAFPEGKPDAVVVKALSDKLGVRRAASAEVLCRAGPGEQRAAIHGLLKDPEPAVRLRTALALAGAKDKTGIPVLIALLGELPPEQAWPAEEYLASLAGEQAPSATGSDPESRAKYRDAWAAWWEQHGDALDLTHQDQFHRLLGYTLVLEQFDHNKRASRLVEVDAAGKVRLEVDGLQYAWDAQILPGDRVLAAEQMAGRVTERDAKGNILWQKNVSQPFTCERLRNGHTFIGARGQLLEVDREGKEVVTYNRPNNDIASAHRLRSGQMVFVTYGGSYVRVDGAGKEVKEIRVPFATNMVNQVEFLPNEHLLVALYNSNKVAEYDLDGKVVWEAAVPAPSSATRLPNGNTLVVSVGNQKVLELNRAGQAVWELKQGNLRPWRARRR